MTNTLTEQWKDGKLPDRCYYVAHRTHKFSEDDEVQIVGTEYLDTLKHFNGTDRAEILAPVPSYEEWQSYDKCADMLIDVNKKWHKTIVENKKLKNQLAIATKALKKMAKDNFQCAEQALEEIELREVK